MRFLALLTTILGFGLLAPAAHAADPQPADNAQAENAKPTPFEFTTVEELARRLAASPYVADEGQQLPEFLAELDYDGYRDIRFKPDHSLWKQEGLPFQVQLFHLGFMFTKQVSINIVEGGTASRLRYNPEWFNFGKNKAPRSLPDNLGFAGFRLHHPLRQDKVFDEITVFLGASYFRAVGLGQLYGLSARGLAIDTGLNKNEEFPVFKEFWIEKPAPQATSITLYALLDSPSVAGAYRFVITPGLDLTVDVSQRLFMRQAVERLGIAPLTSMYFHGENSDRFFDDFRPEVHDSDGLLMAKNSGEWSWRPLNNPKLLRVSVFKDQNPKGFGLLQRDRAFDHYQDIEASYHKRPSTWIEPLGDWGPGGVYLIEIPSDAEKYDNIVAFWMPDKPTAPGQDWSFDYRLHFILDDVLPKSLGRVVASYVGAAGTDVLNSTKRKFVVDFEGDELNLLSDEASVTAQVGTSLDQPIKPIVHKNPETGGWRLIFEVEPGEDEAPLEVWARLLSDQEVLTETWLYQWTKQ